MNLKVCMPNELGTNFQYILHPATYKTSVQTLRVNQHKSFTNVHRNHHFLIEESSTHCQKCKLHQKDTTHDGIMKVLKITNNFSKGFATDNFRKSFTVMFADGNFSVNQDSELYFSLIYDLKTDTKV